MIKILKEIKYDLNDEFNKILYFISELKNINKESLEEYLRHEFCDILLKNINGKDIESNPQLTYTILPYLGFENKNDSFIKDINFKNRLKLNRLDNKYILSSLEKVNSEVLNYFIKISTKYNELEFKIKIFYLINNASSLHEFILNSYFDDMIKPFVSNASQRSEIIKNINMEYFFQHKMNLKINTFLLSIEDDIKNDYKLIEKLVNKLSPEILKHSSIEYNIQRILQMHIGYSAKKTALEIAKNYNETKSLSKFNQGVNYDGTKNIHSFGQAHNISELVLFSIIIYNNIDYKLYSFNEMKEFILSSQISNNELSKTMKHEYKCVLERIKGSIGLNPLLDGPPLMIALSLAVAFVQDDSLGWSKGQQQAKNRLHFLLEGCILASGNNENSYVSCVKGIYERIFVTLGGMHPLFNIFYYSRGLIDEIKDSIHKKCFDLLPIISYSFFKDSLNTNNNEKLKNRTLEYLQKFIDKCIESKIPNCLETIDSSKIHPEVFSKIKEISIPLNKNFLKTSEKIILDKFDTAFEIRRNYTHKIPESWEKIQAFNKNEKRGFDNTFHDFLKIWENLFKKLNETNNISYIKDIKKAFNSDTNKEKYQIIEKKYVDLRSLTKEFQEHEGLLRYPI